MDYGLLAIYCGLILLASLVGGWVPLVLQLTHQRMQVALSCVAGFILGIALLHLLPHAIEVVPVGTAMGWVLVGLLVMFFLERFFHFHEHEPPAPAPAPAPGSGQEGHGHDYENENENEPPEATHGHDQGHAHAHAEHTHAGHGVDYDYENDYENENEEKGHAHGDIPHERSMTWGGVLVGLTMHSVIAGVALAATMAAESMGHTSEAGGRLASGGVGLPGLAVFLVIFLHKPFDSITLGALMAHGGWSKPARHLVNVVFALVVPAGAALFLFGLGTSEVEGSLIVGCAIAFSAGVFLCISLSDLLPELQFHHHDRMKLSAALLFGLALAWAVAHFEAQTHEHEHHLHPNGDDTQAEHIDDAP